jgi:hypothetical protein
VLDSVDACSRALPHMNEAVKKARGIGESMQHVFGAGSIFLTVSFDDDSCFLTQVLSGVQVDNYDDISTLTEADPKECSTKRSQTRLDIPEVTALNFEMLLQILVEEVVGWDMRRDEATKKSRVLRCMSCILFISRRTRTKEFTWSYDSVDSRVQGTTKSAFF